MACSRSRPTRVDGDLTEAFLGLRTIIVNNATATMPFGAIDTPRQGETISGPAYVNFGWALTPQPKSIPPTDRPSASTWTASARYRELQLLPVEDIAALFPGYANSSGAVGFRLIDTTALDDGLHTISWTVVDSLGAAAGIGSRYFSVSNSVTGEMPARFRWASARPCAGRLGQTLVCAAAKSRRHRHRPALGKPRPPAARRGRGPAPDAVAARSARALARAGGCARVCRELVRLSCRSGRDADATLGLRP